MTTVLVAPGSGPSVGSVLDAALRFAELTSSDLEAVIEPRVFGADNRVRALLEEARVPSRPLEGPRSSALVDAVSDRDVLAAVVQAERSGPRRYSVRSDARSLLERTNKPVLVVPAQVQAHDAFRHLLIPLDGAESSSNAVYDRLLPLCTKPVELTVLHVFTDTTMPAMLDRPARDFEILGKEFLHRHLPHVRHIELRLGPIGRRVCEVSLEQGCDLVVLSWSQDTASGRALVIREVLNSAMLPVLLLPIS
jgi:hypothetical protein